MKTRIALVVLAGLLNAACGSESPGGPSLVADVAVGTNAAVPAIVDLWGPGETPVDARAYASAVNQAGVVVGRTGSQVVMWDHGTVTPIAPLSTCSGCFLDRGDFRVGVNAAGQVVGTSQQQAFVWDHSTLTTLDGLGSYASWINDAGDVLGAMGLCNIALNECQGRAVLWRRGNEIPLTFGGIISKPGGLNAAGQVVGQASLPVAPGGPPVIGDEHAFLWQNGTMTDLGTLGGHESSAMGINSQGQVVGFAQTAEEAIHGVVWDHGTTTDLGEGRACAINAAGQIVGESEGRAVVWDHGQEIDIGLSGYGTGEINSLCELGLFQYGPTINAAGDVALNYCTHAGVCSAYLWARGVLTKLADLGGDDARVLGMNARGWLVGRSTTAGGEVHAVLWTR
jgi:probable HAF family extracellular repeat protein